MNEGLRSREEAVVRQLRSRYELSGYEYFEYPTADLLPHFLGSYRPDAIAIGPGRNVAIEVKARRSSGSDEKLDRIARLFEGHPDWQFTVVVAPKSDDDQRFVRADWSQLAGALVEAETLAREGRFRPAVVLGWSVLEEYARSSGLAESSTPAGPREVVQWLTSEGLVTQSASAVFRSVIPLRNAVVHGDFAAPVDAGEVAAFLGEAKILVERGRALGPGSTVPA